MFYFYIPFAIHTGVGYIDFQISSIPKKVTLQTGQKLLIQGIFRQLFSHNSNYSFLKVVTLSYR